VSCSTLLLLRAQIRKKVVARSALIAFRAEGLFVHYFEKYTTLRIRMRFISTLVIQKWLQPAASWRACSARVVTMSEDRKSGSPGNASSPALRSSLTLQIR
jgi:hypothetical protein